jgi:hypothetical protein
MQDTAQLAGFLAAEAILQVSQGKHLCPLVMFENADRTSRLICIQDASGEKAAYKGENILIANAGGAVRGVMAIDAYLNLPQGRKEAIFLQARKFVPGARPMIIAVPYRRAGKRRGFAVHRSKLIAFEDEQLPQAEVLAAFFRGVARHEKGGKFWKAHYDQSY